jgi:metal-dependent amidase/aminoacylase/carboxypeptidase family protein
MHAYGYNCHTAGAAQLLKAREREIVGTVKILFQPAEEGGAGARQMCNEGALQNPTVHRAFGLHVWPYIPTGVIASCTGPMLASAGKLEIVVHGASGHAAMPHGTVDPVVTTRGLWASYRPSCRGSWTPSPPAW